MRITKVTTKTGDKGETTLGRGERVRKDHPRVNALGDLDYLNSVIGWTVSPFSDSQIGRELKKIQQDRENSLKQKTVITFLYFFHLLQIFRLIK